MKCGSIGHFAKKCFSKKQTTENDNKETTQPHKKLKTEESVRWVENATPKPFENVSDEDDVYCVSTKGDNDNTVTCSVGGVTIKAMIDSGCKCNLVDKDTWSILKAKNAIVANQREGSDRVFRAYGGHQLSVTHMFDAYVSIGNAGAKATFYVVAGKGQFLLGRDTAQILNVLRVGTNVNAVQESKTFPKIKGIMVEIPIVRDAKPVTQVYRIKRE